MVPGTHSQASVLSTRPSQLSSLALQTSGLGPTPPTHSPHLPSAVQVFSPGLQGGMSGPQGALSPGMHSHPSSDLLLQLSSTPLQTSPEVGSTEPSQGPHSPNSPPLAMQVWVPDLQALPGPSSLGLPR
jgi:hypothetical protein